VNRSSLIYKVILVALVTSFAGLMACQRKLTPQASCSFLQNPDLQRVSWKSDKPVALYLDTSVPSTAYSALEAAIQVYKDTFHRDVFTIKDYAFTGHPTPTHDGYSVIYWMNTWESDRSNEQGRTTVYSSGNTIYEADMRINDSNPQRLSFNFVATQPPAQSDVDLKSLFIHELGHVLGLDHSQMPGSIMNPYLGDGEERDVLSSQDISHLECEYGHS